MMRLTIISLALSALLSASVRAEPMTAQDLVDFAKEAVSPSVKANDLDKMANRLPGLEGVSSTDERLLLDAYKALSDGYASINHFRQAYLVYRRYLELKESRFVRDFQTTVNKAQVSADQRTTALDDEVGSTRTEADQLMNSAQNYKVVRTFYKRFSALAIITMTFIFAVMLVRSGIRLNNMRRETAEVRKRISGLHRSSSLGRLWKGILQGRKESLLKNAETISQLQTSIQGLNTSGIENPMRTASECLVKTRSAIQEALSQN